MFATEITFGVLEDQINLWINELAQFESDFHEQGQTINSWDSLLVANGEKLIKMNQSIENLNNTHMDLDHKLDFILSQQKELEQMLSEIPDKHALTAANVNAEREHTYSLVELVYNDLNNIGHDLKVMLLVSFHCFHSFNSLQEFIKKLNETKANPNTNDPFVQISKILNSHVDVLQWIEHQVKDLKIN